MLVHIHFFEKILYEKRIYTCENLTLFASKNTTRFSSKNNIIITSRKRRNDQGFFSNFP